MSPLYLQNYFFSGKLQAISQSRRLVDSSDTVTSELQMVSVSHNFMSKNLNYHFKMYYGVNSRGGAKLNTKM